MDRLEEELVAAACPICKGRGWVRRDVPVVHPDFGRAFPCSCQTEAEADHGLARLRTYGNLVGVLSKARFRDLDEHGPGADAKAHMHYHAALTATRAFAAEPAGSLLLTGGHGTGKTRLAAAAANQIMERGVPVLFAFVPSLLDQLRGAYRNEAALPQDELFDQVKNVPVLILDDIDAHSGTPWAKEKLLQIVNHRYVSGLPMLITSAVPLERLDESLQHKLYDMPIARTIDLGSSVSMVEVTYIDPSMTFDSFRPEGKARDQKGKESLAAALTASRSFARDPDGWLVLVGGTGCGKTHLAMAIANEQLARYGEIFVASAPDLLDHLREAFNPDGHVTYDETFGRIRKTPLLILDDYGTQHSTPWANEKMYQIIVHRHAARLPTVITMLTLDDNLNSPITSRLQDTRLVNLKSIVAPSYRPSPHEAGKLVKARKPGIDVVGENC